MATEIHRHRFAYRNLGFGADQARLRLPLLAIRHQKLEEAKSEGPDPEQYPESHDRLTEKAAPAGIIVNNGHGSPRVSFLSMLMEVQPHDLRFFIHPRRPHQTVL